MITGISIPGMPDSGIEKADPEIHHLNADGSLRFSEAQRRRWGLAAGSPVVVRHTPAGLLVCPQDPPLKRVYIEPTSTCNLSCRTCMRHSWSEPTGAMAMETFRRLMEGLKAAPALNTVAFWGMGEPLLHPNIAEMVASAGRLGAETEMITNAMLLDEQKAQALIEAGLSRMVVSVDGVDPSANARNRIGSKLDLVKSNIETLHRLRRRLRRRNPKIGIEFVAMRSNLNQIPKLRTLAYEMGATFIILTNVLPYSEELKDEILYRLSGDRPWSGGISVPRVDARPDILAAIDALLWDGWTAEPVQKFHRNPASGEHCPFVERGSVAVAWNGEVSPCVALMHSHRCYVLDREKTNHRYTLGNVATEDITGIWEQPEFKRFRQRVLDFDFPPCVHCGGCDFVESNREDCFGNPFPVCGDCLWARNVIVCP